MNKTSGNELLMLSTVGLSEDELVKELSANPLTPETVAAVIAKNNQQIVNRVNGALASIHAQLTRK